MRKEGSKESTPEKVVEEIRRKNRRRFSAEEKIRIVLEGLRGEESIATLCRKEGLAPNLYYRWSKEFLEAGKKRLVGDTTREATSTEVTELRKENARLKQLVAETVLENRLLKKSVTAADSDDEAYECPPARSAKRFGWLRTRICRCGARSERSRSRAPRSPAGTGATRPRGWTGSSHARPRHAATGIAFRRPFANVSWIWRWSPPSGHRASSPGNLRIGRAISSRSRASTAF